MSLSDRCKINLHNADCMELLKTYKDNQFDLAIVDPPYGIGKNGDRNHTRGKLAKPKNYKSFAGGDISAPNEEYFSELRRVSKNQIIWGANHFIDNIGFSKSSPCWIVWDKVNGATDFADCELAWTSFKTAVRQIRFMWNGMLQGKSIKDGHTVQGNKKLNECRIHPTQKPVKLYKWLLQNFAKEGDTILDTHLGSGSIAIACHDLEFDLVGIELDKDYFNKGKSRLEKHASQMQLF